MIEVTHFERVRRVRADLMDAGDAVFAADAETGRLIDANLAAQSLIGLPRDELLAMEQAQLHPPELASEVREMFARAGENAMGGNLFETELLDAGGRRVPVEIRTSVIELDGRRCVLGVFRNISDRKRVEAALQASERRFRTMLETIPAAIFLSDESHTRLDYVSSHFTRLLGYTLEDIPTLERWYELAFPDPEQRRDLMDFCQRELELAMRDSTHASARQTLVTRKDGTQRQILWNTRFLDGRLLGSGFDLTDTLMAQARQRESDAILRSTLVSRYESLIAFQIAFFARVTESRIFRADLVHTNGLAA